MSFLSKFLKRYLSIFKLSLIPHIQTNRRVSVNPNLLLGFHFQDAASSYNFTEVTGKTPLSGNNSGRIFNQGSGYRTVLDMPFSNASQLSDNSGHSHTLATMSGTLPAAGAEYISFNPSSSQYARMAIGDAYQGDFDPYEDIKITFTVAISGSQTTSPVTIFHLTNSIPESSSPVRINVAVSGGTWKMQLVSYAGSTTGTATHTCSSSISPYSNFYTLTFTKTQNVITLSDGSETITQTIPTNNWYHYLTSTGFLIGAYNNSGSTLTPAGYARFALKNLKYELRDNYPTIPSNGAFGSYARFTGGNVLAYATTFSLTVSSSWTFGVRVLIPSGPIASLAKVVPIGFYNGATTYGWIYLDTSVNTIKFAGTNGTGTASYTFARDTWYTLLVARNGATNQTRIYVNGTQVGATSNVYFSGTNITMTVGGAPPGMFVAYETAGNMFLSDFYFRTICEQTGASYTLPTGPFPDS